jgi:hypothetical protein
MLFGGILPLGWFYFDCEKAYKRRSKVEEIRRSALFIFHAKREETLRNAKVLYNDLLNIVIRQVTLCARSAIVETIL